jgi:hypothetical protein
MAAATAFAAAVVASVATAPCEATAGAVDIGTTGFGAAIGIAGIARPFR